MTIVPSGAHLAPVNLPPPPPQCDPREPSPVVTSRHRPIATPQRPLSPAGLRGPSPIRPQAQRSPSAEPSSLPLVQPEPRTLSPSVPGIPISSPLHHHHPYLSRPSSPSTSIQSSTSAIFERDIELPAVASLLINQNPLQPHALHHKSSRLNHPSHGSPLDQTIPTVLDDAVEALAGSGDSRGWDNLEIESPITNQPAPSSRIPSGMMLTSRSGSPASGGSASPAQSPPILAQLSTHQKPLAGEQARNESLSIPVVDATVPRPSEPNKTDESMPQLGAFVFGRTMRERSRSPPAHHDDLLHPSGSPQVALPSHFAATNNKRRVSFISYNDILLSVPTTVTPLGNIASGTMSPDHLPGTISPNITTRSPVIQSPTGPGMTPLMDHKTSGDIGAPGRGSGGLGLGEGEWERQGLGRGLEQRLEDLVHTE